MDRKTYMKDIYSKYWLIARKKEYGFLQYDKDLCSYINKNIKQREKILEVAIGTGFPFGDFFQKKNYEIHGIDVAPILIEECRKLNDKIICKVGDAENLDYPNNFFKCVYCFHSTFYFSDICKAIGEMLRVVESNGIVIFDIQNRNNKTINDGFNKMKLYKNNGFWKLVRFGKNIIKLILKNKVPDWTNIVYEVPTYPEIIIKYLRDKKIDNYNIMVKSKKNYGLEVKNDLTSIKDYPRLVFVIRMK